jgi:hypothetical protein
VSLEPLSALCDLIAPQYDFVVFDLNDEIMSTESLASIDRSREEITTWAIARSDLVITPFVSDPVGVNRFLFDRQLADFDFWPIANRFSPKPQGGSAMQKLKGALELVLETPLKSILPADAVACDSSITNARPLMLESPSSKLTLAIRSLACEIADHRHPKINSESGQI